jgi:tellurite resistance protein TerC
MENPILLWVGFNLFVLFMLALDLGVFHRNSHEVKIKEALIWSAVWIGLALVFNAGIWYYMGEVKAVEFLTGYIVEKSLSVDNIFVFVLIFGAFQVPAAYQHRVLFWGVFGAWLCGQYSYSPEFRSSPNSTGSFMFLALF